MPWLRAVALVLATYTRIPMPKVKWEGEATKVAIAFLPLAGLAVGLAVWGWQIACRSWGLSAVLFAAVAAALPLVVTGGIHMDGYCDTSDALASRQDKERALDILKDAHVGAFALIRFGTYILVNFALFHELFLRGYDAGAGFLYVLSRCFAAWSVVTMPGARKNGMLAAFTEQADRAVVRVILALLTALGLAGWLCFTFPRGMVGLLVCLPLTLWYRGMAKKRFGGVTGDTTGYYLQMVELGLQVGLLAGGIACEWFTG